MALREIGPQLECSHETVRKVLLEPSGSTWPSGCVVAGVGSVDAGRPRGDQSRSARRRDVHGDREPGGPCGVERSREVAANGGRGDYRAWRAHQRARARTRRPKTSKLTHRPLAAQVERWLTEWWSPEAIARRCASSSRTIR